MSYFFLFLSSFAILHLYKEYTEKCAYKSLMYGLTAYGMDRDGRLIKDSRIIARNGPESIKTIDYLWHDKSAFIICIQPSLKNGEIINDDNGNNIHGNQYYDLLNNDEIINLQYNDYSSLNNGVIAWGMENWDILAAPMGIIHTTDFYTTENGLDTIKAFSHLTNDLDVKYICFQRNRQFGL